MENLHFTYEEEQLLQKHVDDIKNYIITMIVPQLKVNLYIEFGGEYEDPRSGEKTSKYGLAIYKRPSLITSGWNKNVEGQVSLRGGFGRLIELSYIHFEKQYVLVKNWDIVKAKITEAIRKQEEESDFLKNFKI